MKSGHGTTARGPSLYQIFVPHLVLGVESIFVSHLAVVLCVQFCFIFFSFVAPPPAPRGLHTHTEKGKEEKKRR